MVSSLTLLFSSWGYQHSCYFVDLAKVFDHLINNEMELKAYRKETKESK